MPSQTDQAPKSSSSRQAGRANWRRRALVHQYGLAVALVVIGTALSVANPHFLTGTNLLGVLLQISINGILAVGVTFVLLTGGVDLSLGSIVALSGVVAAHFAQRGGPPVMVPVFMGVFAGACCGAANGAVITRLRVAPFIVTLGMMTIARGLALILSGGRPVSNLSPEFKWLGGAWNGVPIPVVVLFAVTLLSALVLRNLTLGRHLYAVGGNEQAARAAGLRVRGIKTFAYVVSGAMAGLAGVVLAARITTGQPNAGIAYELDAIAAVVIGGTSLSGGVGGVGGTILGALLIGVINNGLDLMNVSSYYQQVIKGLIIIGAVALDRRDKS